MYKNTNELMILDYFYTNLKEGFSKCNRHKL